MTHFVRLQVAAGLAERFRTRRAGWRGRDRVLWSRAHLSSPGRAGPRWSRSTGPTASVDGARESRRPSKTPSPLPTLRNRARPPVRPKTRDGNARIHACFTCRLPIRAELRGLDVFHLLERASTYRPGAKRDTVSLTKFSLRMLARRAITLEEEMTRDRRHPRALGQRDRTRARRHARHRHRRSSSRAPRRRWRQPSATSATRPRSRTSAAPPRSTPAAVSTHR